MNKKNNKRCGTLIAFYLALLMVYPSILCAQVVGPQEIKWVKVSSLHQWFSSGGAEIEYGRRSRQFLQSDQLDGLNWPGLYTTNKGVNVGNALWIGTTNFADPVSNKTYPYKVVCDGRLFLYLNSEIYPEQIMEIGRYDHPQVLVDDVPASDRNYDDNVDQVDPNLPCDRMVITKIHTTIGIDVTRKVYVYTQQYHDNYFIYEYVFKNTGIIDGTGQQKLNNPLTDVVFFFQHRYGFAGESYLPVSSWAPTGASWGLNTINDVYNPTHLGPFRAAWSYYGPVSTAPSVLEDIGLPRYTDGSILAGTNFAGVVVLHADRSTADHSDDPNQPSTTRRMGSDQDAQTIDQYDDALMTRKYGYMTAGHPAKSHAEEVGKDPVTGWPTSFANNPQGLSDPGGYSCAQGFGPYTFAMGDSVRIVFAEGVAGLMSDRDFVRQIARNWFSGSAPFPLPGGGTTGDRNTYKNTWVFTGKDSLFQTFQRAITNYNNGQFNNIDQPPLPPTQFNVRSGGNQIVLNWQPSPSESNANFNGYAIYRAEGRTDTTFNEVFSCDKSNLAYTFSDKSPRRGFDYYYYIVAKDDGSTNSIQPGAPLVSSKYLTMTNKAANLTRVPGKSLADIRVVPNPYNIRARGLQFGYSNPDRLAFFGLPAYCIIKIYTETGDLIKTIEHTSTSGDEYWNSLTSSEQLVVSGIYIAYFEVTQDIFEEGTGRQLFRKGENAIRKFVIIR
ncbi:MAG: hypothetical protein JXA06_04795 [Bacteroidetes bacterium]|nr:hypothetical protein [Bacteroidota bacterium]